ncbi:MAG: hypothetical protein FVQ82_05290 [Planctomycetes bacterium]|nr:hypothetical protein [Planctomycetota bacterium]
MIDPYKKKKNGLYRPIINKKNYNTPGRYSRFMNQSNDPNDWGYRKRHIYGWDQMDDNMVELNDNDNTKHQLKGSINYSYTYNKGKPFGTGKNRVIINSIDDIKELDKYAPEYPGYLDDWNYTGKITMHKQRRLCMETHLLAALHGRKQGFLFYTTSPVKDFNIICLDVDDIESDEAYYAVVKYLSSIFPNCYYERSTNGTGLHFYIIVSFPPARYLFSEVNEGAYRNLLYHLLSEALRSFVNDNFAVKFDAVKGTNTIYDDHNNFLKFGTLVKLPAPVKYEQFNALYSASIYSEDHLLCIINYLNDITCEYSSGVYNVSSLMASLKLILKDTPIRTSPRDMLSEIKKRNNPSSSTSTYSTSYSTIYLYPTYTITNGGTNCLPKKKVGNKPKNNDLKNYTIIDIMNIGDSRIRESLYIKKYVRSYYSRHGAIPPEHEVEQNYRVEMSYHKVGDYRRKRFSKYYKHTVNTFDPDKASDGASPYKVGMYGSVIDKSDEQITEWVKNNTSYKRNVYRYDVDITLEYIYICSKNKKNRARERAIKRLAKQDNVSEAQAEIMLKNTTPRKGLIGFYEFVQEKYKTVVVDGKMKKINGCDGKKASALLYLVVKLKLAICFDNTSDYGKARKFKLSEAVSQVRGSWNVKDKSRDRKAG